VYEELGEAYAFAKDSVVIAKVDADAHQSLGSRFGVQGFPTLKWCGAYSYIFSRSFSFTCPIIKK
jgi:hypothetical protein